MTNQDERSKSEIKREYLEITKLGERLLLLSSQQLAEIPLSELTLSAIAETQKIKSNIGRKRQLKYLGKILRDEDIPVVTDKLFMIDQHKMIKNKQHHKLEHWRDRLLSDGDKAISELVKLDPTIDRQHLRQLVRNGQNEIKKQKSPKYQRELFKYLRENTNLD